MAGKIMSQLNFSPFPALTTERLLLRQLTAADENALFILRTDDTVNQYLDRLKARSLEDVRRFMQKINTSISNNESLYWAISLKTDPALIGTVCLYNISPAEKKGEVGYELLPAFQGKGYMQEALAEVIRFSFDTIQIKNLEAMADIKNERSAGLLQKLCFKRDTGKEAELLETENLKDITVYTLSREKFYEQG